MKNKISETSIGVLVPDDLNANKGTEFGGHLIEKSLRELGAGRSILIDKNNRIIAGNKTIENAASIGLSKVIIIETTGDQIVAVKRTDIDIDSKIGREMALADNATSKANLVWDEENIKQVQSSWEVVPEDWGVKLDFEPAKDPFEDTGISSKSQYGIIVMCDSELQQSNTFTSLSDMGYKCKVVVV